MAALFSLNFCLTCKKPVFYGGFNIEYGNSIINTKNLVILPGLFLADERIKDG